MTVKKSIMSTADFPAVLDDEARFKLWHDTYCDWVGATDLGRMSDAPFTAQWEFISFKETLLARFQGTTQSIARTAQQIAAAPQDRYFLSVNSGTTALSFAQGRKESTIGAGQALFFSGTDAFRCEGASDWISIGLPKPAMQQPVPNVEDLIALPLDSAQPAMRHLLRYVDILLEPDGLDNDSALAEQVEKTLLDMAVLALGGAGDGAAIARMRGLRAARCTEILHEIAKGFADPAFSAKGVAAKLGLSSSYLEKLLHETGLSFTGRVLELRLQRARRMLADRRHDHLKVGEIAFACGFNELSYFHRCFRRRFGASPAQFRGSDERA
jgi:AraC-like DNA-binding protein